MTATRSYTIHCDGCGESDGGDLGARTAAERRRDVARDGWKVGKEGTDWCTDCQANGKMKAHNKRAEFRAKVRRESKRARA